MIQEFIKKYSNDKEMLLKILRTIYAELVVRHDEISKKDNISELDRGKMDAWRDLLDYFDIDFLEENLNFLYSLYTEKLNLPANHDKRSEN